MRNVRDQADVVLYLVNAAEDPEDAGYVDPEMQLLGWIGKPVVVLLNQLGRAATRRGRSRRGRALARHLRHAPDRPRRAALDAFARCWVQEDAVRRGRARAAEAERPAMARLRDAWRARRVATFDAAVQAIAASLARIATMSETVPDSGGVRARLRQVGAAIGIGRAEPGPPPRRSDRSPRASTRSCARTRASCSPCTASAAPPRARSGPASRRLRPAPAPRRDAGGHVGWRRHRRARRASRPTC